MPIKFWHFFFPLTLARHYHKNLIIMFFVSYKMSNKIDAFFENLLHFFKINDIDKITNLCSFPLPVYLRGGIMVLGAPKNSRDAIAAYRTSLANMGWAYSNSRVIAQSMVDENQLSVWVESQHRDANEKVVAESTTRYFCKLESDKISKIELIEYLDAPPQNTTQEWPKPFF